jgi:1-acyl-sn-glycerol-3-phosphate acyltransferase
MDLLRLLCIVLYVIGWFIFHIPFIHFVKQKPHKEELLNAKLKGLINRILKIAGVKVKTFVWDLDERDWTHSLK